MFIELQKRGKNMPLETLEWILFLVGAIFFAIGGWRMTKTTRYRRSTDGGRTWSIISDTNPTPLGCTLEIIGALILAAWLFLVFYGPQIIAGAHH